MEGDLFGRVGSRQFVSWSQGVAENVLHVPLVSIYTTGSPAQRVQASTGDVSIV